ncbi:molybdopterin guanine dinucleotide biosynthesis accessory protein MobB [Clostridium sp. DSM 8431]|uniref:molybdopterin-guanine dinucleotide biosynthesis protein B n=1 Tax=Clostridium sp. DSM 8431 TaxID=1761781 RepID=UPI0008DF69EB|nr:molybdopterin-guanine dinucleotide biosynthesis protein B [Clostridium sp. DSM 8431]SFU57446.1 molybdopterin guanine dinucleotide biosynthesis accessory protein MobB [Clostridium sp. DSM 8431]
MKKKSKPVLLAISGVKNSGKTTLIERILPKLKEAGYKAATVKHDGHDFEVDVEGTDTYKHRKAGAYGTAIFSKNKFMVIKEQKDTKEEELISYFSEADIIILEGFKYSDYPKIEIVRKGNSEKSVCKKETILALATDIENFDSSINIVDLNDIDSIVNLIIEFIKGRDNEGHF